MSLTLCARNRELLDIIQFIILHKNGVEERMNRTLIEKVRCMLSNAQLSKSFLGKICVHCMLFDQPFSLNYYREEDYSRGMVW